MKHLNSVPIRSSQGTEFWVREDFLRWCPHPEEYENYQLINNYGMRAYLHREDGYAIPETKAYYLNGEHVPEENMIIVKFGQKLNKLIED